MSSKLVIVKGEGEAQQILCFARSSGQFWRPVHTERLMGFSSTRLFDTHKGALLARNLMGGETLTVLHTG